MSRPARPAEESPQSGVEVVALVTSAGGLEALTRVLSALPAGFGAAVVVAQHLGGQGSRLVEILDRRIALPVEWAREGVRVEPGRVTVCRPRSVLEILPDRTCAVRAREGARADRPLDVLLRSIGDSFGAAALAVVLTGMGDDGAAGAAAVREAGGVVIAQSEDTAEHPAMPRAAVATGAVDLVLPLHEIGPVLVDVVAGQPLPRPDYEREAVRRTFGDHGEVGRMARGVNWAGTPLGAVSGWPEALRVATRMAVDSAHGVTLFLGDDHLVVANEVGVSLQGGHHDRVFARPYAEAYPEAVDYMLPVLARVRAGERVHHEATIVPFVRHGRTENAWFDMSYTPICSGDGTVVGVQQTFLDRTSEVLSRRRLETLNRLAAVTAPTRNEAMSATIAVLAASQDVPFAAAYLLTPAGGAALAAACGVEPGSPMAPHRMGVRRGAAWPLRRAIEAEAEVVLDDVAERFRGQRVSDEALALEQAVLLPLRGAADGGADGVLVLGVHPRLPLDAGYRAFLTSVGEAIAATAQDAQARQRERQRLERLAALDRAKIEFFSNVSHEFRTPLTLMLGPLEGLLQEGAALSPRHRTDVEVMLRSTRRLLRMVDTMLDFAQIEEGRLRARFAPVDLAARTREIVALFESAAAHAALDLRVTLEQLPERVWVDVEMWEKIVSNLLSNALKFTFEGTIEVTLRALPKHVELVVRDTGVGIPEPDLPHVLKRFHRVRDARARTHEGAGIGLALVDELVRRHHGRVRVTSTVGEGTAFTVWLPLGRRPAVAEPPPEAPDGTTAFAASMAQEALQWGTAAPPLLLPDDAVGPMRSYAHDARLLVADDHKDMRDYLTRLLRAHWEVDTAANGAEALMRARHAPPDLVVADVMMPGLDGFALLRELRDDPRLRTVPVVLVTARAGEEAAIEGLLAGADDYIVKPFSARELVARVGGQLELARARRRHQELNAFLVRFSDAVRGLTDPAEVAGTACRMILDQLGGHRAYWSELDWTARDWVTVGEAHGPAVPAIAGRYPMDAWEPGTSRLVQGRSWVVDDIQADPRLPAALKEECARLEMAANLAVPVLADGKARCVLAVDHHEPRRWSADELALVEGVAVRCWGEVERARAEAALRRSEERQAFLLELGDALRPLRDASDIKAAATRILAGRLGVNRAFYSEMTGDEWIIEDVFEQGIQPLPHGGYPADTYGRWTMDTLRDDRVIAVAATATDARLRPSERRALQRIGVAAVVGVPLVRGGEVVAVLSLHSREPREWTEEELDLVRETANRTWPAVERVRAETALRASEQRQAFLLKLSDELRPLAAPDEIQGTAARVLGEHLGAARVMFSEITGEPRLSGDSDGGVGVALVVAVREGGRCVAELVVHSAQPREWTAEEITLAEAAAERTWAAAEAARREIDARGP